MATYIRFNSRRPGQEESRGEGMVVESMLEGSRCRTSQMADEARESRSDTGHIKNAKVCVTTTAGEKGGRIYLVGEMRGTSMALVINLGSGYADRGLRRGIRVPCSSSAGNWGIRGFSATIHVRDQCTAQVPA